MLSNLNNAQKQAVEYVVGPLLIVAGAGTGKTTVITRKIAYLIEKKLAKAEEILALTFTDKAAQEMTDRVDGLLNIGYADMQISTFHAFCQKILERYGLDIGLSNQFKLLTATDAWLLARNNFDKFNLDYYRPLGNPTRHIHELLKHFSKCKDELIAPAEYLEYAESVRLDTDNVITPPSPPSRGDSGDISRLREIANAYHVYNQLLLDNNSLDFGDLIFYAIQLLEKRPRILSALRERFQYILVDEFQDVNWAQYQLVRKLTGEGSQMTVVGDDDQSIYAFRGASVSNIMRFKDDYPKAKEIVLTENYRSRQDILDSAYKLIQNNNPDRLEVKLGVEKKLTAAEGSPRHDNVIHLHSATLDDEVKSALDEVVKIKEANKETVWDDFAILVRANNHAEPFINALEKRGIPYEFLSSAGLYRQPIVLDAVNFFKAITDYHESAAVYRLLCLPFLKLKEHDLQKITHEAKKKSVSLYAALKRAAEFGVSQESVAIIDKILALIHNGMSSARLAKPTAALYQFLNDSGYLKYLTHEEGRGNWEVIRQIYHLRQFFEYIAEFETAAPGARARNFLEHYEFVLDSGDAGKMRQPADTPDSLNILTVHAAKGLEFKYVFAVNLVEDRFPSRDRGDGIEIPLALIKEQLPEGDSHWQEERRLFYVAMTRARERLYLTSADDYGGARAKKLSRFLAELGYVCHSSDVRRRNLNREQIDFCFRRNDSAIDETAAPPAEVCDNSGFAYALPAAFSFSQIKSYATCPYQYKLAHILRIPSRGNASFSFGQTMHGALHEFYQKIQEINKSEQGSLFGILSAPAAPKNKKIKAPALEELLALYKKHWLEDWYKSPSQREAYFKKGEEILRLFYQTQEDNWTAPVCLESWFKIKIGDYLLRGRLDRIDQMPDGALEIIDYKTGKAKDKVTGEDKDQLLIYQIAVEQLPEYQAIGRPAKLTYVYLNDNIRVSFLGEEKEKAKLEEKLRATIGAIHSGNFLATPGKFVCEHCDFKDVCDYRE